MEIVTSNGTHELPTTAKEDFRRMAKKPPGVAFDDEIPREGPEIFVLRIKGGRMYTFSIWGTQIRGVWAHWTGLRSEPHYNDESECPGCKALKPKRWKGYLHCYCYEMRQEVFLELTPNSASALKQQLASGMSMRGSRVQIRRTKADNGRLEVAFLARVETVDAIPPEKDPRPSILKLWGVPEKEAMRWIGGKGGGCEPEQFT